MINLTGERNMNQQTSTCIDYEKELNPAQLEAVTVPSGPGACR